MLRRLFVRHTVFTELSRESIHQHEAPLLDASFLTPWRNDQMTSPSPQTPSSPQSVCLQLRLSFQDSLNWRLWSGKVKSLEPFHAERVLAGVQVDHRRRIRHAQHPGACTSLTCASSVMRRRDSGGRQDDKSPNLGHSWSGEIPSNHQCLLQRCSWCPPRL